MSKNSIIFLNKDLEQEKIQILQHNYIKSRFIIKLCLQNAIETTNTVLI